MFDDNHWWYTEMKQRQLKDRLANLPLDLLVAYSVGCATHANKVVCSDVPTQELVEFRAATLLLEKFWDGYPQILSIANLTSIAKTAEEFVASELGEEPDEMLLQAPGAEPLLWATLYALTLALNPTPVVPAYSAVGRSYFAVYSRYAKDEQAINEGRMYEVEKTTRQCVDEIGFQLNYLRLLETTKTLPHSYSEISACAD